MCSKGRKTHEIIIKIIFKEKAKSVHFNKMA